MAVDNLSSIRRNLSKAQNELNETNNRLASGKRINNAKDDAAGLAIAEALKADAVTLSAGSRNVDYGVSIANIADSAMGTLSDISVRMSELSTQAANGTLSDDQRAALNDEYQQLAQEAQRIVDTTEFNGQKVFSGESVSLQVGTGSDPNSQIKLEGTDIAAVVSTLASQDISTQAGAQAALEGVKQGIGDLAAKRGEMGASVSRLQVAQRNNEASVENIRAAESRIRDADIAEETARGVGQKIRAQVSTALFAQGKLEKENVLRLLQ